MDLKLFVLVILIGIVKARFDIEFTMDENKHIVMFFSGSEEDFISQDEIKLFKIEDEKIASAIQPYFYGKKPKDIYFKSPTPLGDVFESVKRKLFILTSRTSFTINPVEVLSRDFENASNKSIKVNTGITHTIENTLTTSWSKEKELTVSEDIKHGFEATFAKMTGNTSFSFNNMNWGVSENKSETETIGKSSGMETELQPGQAVRAVLTANAGYLQIVVFYAASLTGQIGVNFEEEIHGHNFWIPEISTVMDDGGISNEVIITTETINFSFYDDASVKVYDKQTGLPV